MPDTTGSSARDAARAWLSDDPLPVTLLPLWPVLRPVATLTLLGDPDRLEERATWAEAAERPYAPEIRRDADAARQAADELAAYRARFDQEAVKFATGTRGPDVLWRTLVVGVIHDAWQPFYAEEAGDHRDAPLELREWIAYRAAGILAPEELDTRSGGPIESAITSWRKNRDRYRPIIRRIGVLTPERVEEILNQAAADPDESENPN